MTESTYDPAPHADDTPAPAAMPEPTPKPKGPTPMTLAGKLLAALLILGLLAGAGGGYYLFKMLKPSFTAEATLHITPTDDPLAPHIAAISELPETRAMKDLGIELTLTPDDATSTIHLNSLTGPASEGMGQAAAITTVNSVAEAYAKLTYKAHRAACNDEMTDLQAQMELADTQITQLTDALTNIGEREALEAKRTQYAEQIGALPAELKILTEGLNLASAEEARLQAIIDSETIDGFPDEAFAELANDYQYMQLKNQIESYEQMIEQTKADTPDHPALAQWQNQLDIFIGQKRPYETAAMEAFMSTVRERSNVALDELQQLQYTARATATRLAQVDEQLATYDLKQEQLAAARTERATLSAAHVDASARRALPPAITATLAETTETIWPDYRQPAMIACTAGAGVSLIGLLALILAAQRRKAPVT